MNSKILDMDYTVGEVELTYKSTSKSRNKIYSSEDAYFQHIRKVQSVTKNISKSCS